jgi:thioredoxin 1
MLRTNLGHIADENEFQKTLTEHENVMICCGRMGPMCVPVYGAMEHLERSYKHVTFRDMEFDAPVGRVIRSLPECAHFMGLPFTVYFRNGSVVHATSSIQSMDEITAILDREFKGAAAR